MTFRVVLAFFLVAVSVIAVAWRGATRIERAVASSVSFHTPALYAIQAMRGDVAEAVEEVVAYLLSGETVERDEFLAWAERFPREAEQFELIARLGDEAEATERVAFLRILEEQRELTVQGRALIADYERMGRVDARSFQRFEQIIDQVPGSLNELIQIEKQEVDAIQRVASAALVEARRYFWAAGLAVVVSALTGGGFLAGLLIREMNLRLEAMQAARDAQPQRRDDWSKPAGLAKAPDA